MMRYTFHKLGFWLVVLLWATAVSAQPLDSLIKRAEEQNLELKNLHSQYLAALERAPQVDQLPDPEVGVGTFPLPVETRLGAQAVRVGASQMFPWFGTLESKRELELSKAKVLYERIDAYRLDLAYQVKQAYFRLYEIEESRAIIRRNISILNALERLALSRVESGKATAADVLRVQLKIEELEQELDVLEAARKKPLARINQLLDRNLETGVIISDSLRFATILFDRDSLAANIASRHPMLRMFALQQEVSEQTRQLNQLDGKPAFGVGLDYIMVNKRTDAEPLHNGRDIVQLRASVKIPLYRTKYEAKDREEVLKIEALEHRKADVLSGFLESVEAAFTDYDVAQLRAELYRKQIDITQSAINILQADYSSHGNNFDELLRLEKELIDYDLKILKAIVDSHLAKASIERFIN
jgi:outer membrane protein TolC